MTRGIVCLALGAVALLAFTGCGRSQREIREELAPAVCDYLEANFTTLDANGDGVISETELSTAGKSALERRKRGEVKAEREAYLLGHISDNVSRIGHVTGSHTEDYTDVIYVPIGDGLFPIFTSGTRTVDDYGISLQDVKTYRVARRT